MTTDVLLNQDKGYFDFEWTENGDLSTCESLDTMIWMCLFEEKRATSSEVDRPEFRRGWSGNESTPDFEIGSKIWQYSQERITGTLLTSLRTDIRAALQPLIDIAKAESVEVDKPTAKKDGVYVNITIKRSPTEIEKRFFRLWDNTGR